MAERFEESVQKYTSICPVLRYDIILLYIYLTRKDEKNQRDLCKQRKSVEYNKRFNNRRANTCAYFSIRDIFYNHAYKNETIVKIHYNGI